MKNYIKIIFAGGITALLVSFQINKLAVKSFEKDGNIYVMFSDNSTKQLTYSKADSKPLLLKKENSIVFVRLTHNDMNEPNAKKIVKVNCNSLLEKTVTDQKPYQDGNAFTNSILNIDNPTISEDEKFIYFITEAYATNDLLVEVDLTTGKWYKLFDAMSYELITRGSYKNLFLVGKSEIKERGRDVYYYLVNEKGEVQKEFDSKEDCNNFKSKFINSN